MPGFFDDLMPSNQAPEKTSGYFDDLIPNRQQTATDSVDAAIADSYARISGPKVPEFKTVGALFDFARELPKDDPRYPEIAKRVESNLAEDPFLLSLSRKVGLTSSPLEPKTGYEKLTESLGEYQAASAEQINSAIMNNPVGRVLAELGAGVGRTVARTGDTFIIGPANAVRDLENKMGLDEKIEPLQTVESGMNESLGMDQPYMKEGLGRDIVKTVGENLPVVAGLGSGFRYAAEKLVPKATAMTTPTTAQNIVKQLGTSTPMADVGYGAISAAGSEVGKEIGSQYYDEEHGGELGAQVGQFVGAILAPTTVVGGKEALKGLFSLGKRGFQALTGSLMQLSDDGAAELLARQMVAEGMSPEDVTKRLADLGPEAIPADVGESFSQLLRTAINKIPRIKADSSRFLNPRQAGSAQRVTRGLSGISGLQADDAIKALEISTKAKYDAQYALAQKKAVRMPEKLQNLFTGDSSIAKAARQAQNALADERAMGKQVGHLNLIDETKKTLDDRIATALKADKKGLVRRLVRVKNYMVGVADDEIPEYKAAREIFAGKAQLEDAVDIGRNYFKLNKRELANITQTMSDSEMQMFRLGAKEAIEDKIYDVHTNADLIRRLFGKNGDAFKLKPLFPDEATFNEFNRRMEREAQFALTRRAAQGGSTTAQQAQDLVQIEAANALHDARALMGDPREAANMFHRIMAGIRNKRANAESIKAFEKAGDILLENGMDPARLQKILRRGNAQMLERELTRVLIDTTPRFASPTARAAAANQINNLYEQPEEEF